jgi:hypothetical protein
MNLYKFISIMYTDRRQGQVSGMNTVDIVFIKVKKIIMDFLDLFKLIKTININKIQYYN